MSEKPEQEGFFNYEDNYLFNIWVHAGMAVKILCAIALMVFLYFYI